MILEDFVMLGTTVPEPSSDGRVFVCSAGYSAELGQLVRVYPLARSGAPRRWSVNRVRLERNRRDQRRESWSIAADRTPAAHGHINQAFHQLHTIDRAQRVGLLDKVRVSSIAEANERRLSLALVHPRSVPTVRFDHNEDSPDSPQLRLFDCDDAPSSGAKRFAYIPRVVFEDDAGCHALMLRDWGAFEWMRKQGDARRYDIPRNLHLGESSSLLVGNLSHQRTAWLVISVLNGVVENQPTLFDERVAS